MPLQVIILVASLVITWLIFTWLIDIFKVSLKTAVSVMIILLILQFSLGISSQEIWQQIINLPQTIQQLFNK